MRALAWKQWQVYSLFDIIFTPKMLIILTKYLSLLFFYVYQLVDHFIILLWNKCFGHLMILKCRQKQQRKRWKLFSRYKQVSSSLIVKINCFLLSVMIGFYNNHWIWKAHFLRPKRTSIFFLTFLRLFYVYFNNWITERKKSFSPILGSGCGYS